MKDEDLQGLSFEDALLKLENIVRELVSGRIKLDDAVTAYEQAVKLKQFCEQKLQAAQLKIEKIEIAPDGTLAGGAGGGSARAAQWDKDPEEFVAALTSASLLDVTEDGVLEIHDWSEYTGKLIEQRENEKNRSRARRAAAKSNARRTTAGQSADASKSDQKKTAGRVGKTRVEES